MADRRKATNVVGRTADSNTTASEPAPGWTTEPRGVQPPAGHHRVGLNLRRDLWDELQRALGDDGPPVVVVVEALLDLYLDDPRLRARVDADTDAVAAARRRVARRTRPAR